MEPTERIEKIKEIAELIHNAGLNAHTHPQSASAEEWNEYRFSLAEYLFDYGCRMIQSKE